MPSLWLELDRSMTPFFLRLSLGPWPHHWPQLHRPWPLPPALQRPLPRLLAGRAAPRSRLSTRGVPIAWPHSRIETAGAVPLVHPWGRWLEPLHGRLIQPPRLPPHLPPEAPSQGLLVQSPGPGQKPPLWSQKGREMLPGRTAAAAPAPQCPPDCSLGWNCPRAHQRQPLPGQAQVRGVFVSCCLDSCVSGGSGVLR